MTLKEKLAAAQRAAGNDITPSEQAFDAMFSGLGKFNPDGNKIVQLPVDKLRPFSGHTFTLHEGDPDYLALTESIREHGIREPLIVRPHPYIADSYEIITGHRRHHIATIIGLHDVPCIITALDNNTAIKLMAETNINRPDWLPSEKAHTYAAHLSATRASSGIKLGRPQHSFDDSDSSSEELQRLRNRDIAAQFWGIDGTTFQRYLKLNDLIPSLLDLVDDGRISVIAGYHIAFLDNQAQEMIFRAMDMYPTKKIDNAKGVTIKQASVSGTLDEQLLLRILGVIPIESVRKPIKIALSSTALTKPSTIKQALDDASVLEQIEHILISYAKEHNLPLT